MQRIIADTVIYARREINALLQSGWRVVPGTTVFYSAAYRPEKGRYAQADPPTGFSLHLSVVVEDVSNVGRETK